MSASRAIALLLLLIACGASVAQAQTPRVTGVIRDPLGGVVPGAAVVLRHDEQDVAKTASDAAGLYAFQDVAAGRYQVRVAAAGFDPRASAPFFLSAGSASIIDVTLSVGPLQERVIVTATASDAPASQVGASVSVLDQAAIGALGKPDLLEALRLVPGTQVVQTGQRGGTTSFFVRGGAAAFNKVLIDGVPANDIGGAFDFSQLTTAGVGRVEVLREANSVLYGADSLSGVVSITTPRGSTRTPDVQVGIDGGTLDTVRQTASIGGASGRFDYFSEYAFFRTDNDLPNNTYRNGTYAGRFGVSAGRGTDVSATVRRIDTRYGSPNAFAFYGIPDDSTQQGDQTYVGLIAQSQVNARLQTVVRFASMRQMLDTENPTPTGEPFDPFGGGPNYLGQTTRITGANGYSVSGRAILDYGGLYPSVFNAHTTRNLLSGQASYRLTSALELSGGGRIEHESGWTQFAANPRDTSERTNGGAFVEGRVSARRLFVTGGVGVEHNAVFGTTASPRVSAIAYVRTAPTGAAFGDTKLLANAGRGIKAPSISQQLSSLFALIPADHSAASRVDPIGPERARTVDAGVEQDLLQGRLRVRATFFDNRFSDLIEYVSKNVLPQVGVPSDVAAGVPFGAYVNAQSYKARGLEWSADVRTGGLRAAASYTYLDAIVTRSFSSDALSPAINPEFPGVPIGAYSPLVGARPFRRPTHSGNLLLSYVRGPAQVTLAGYFSGKQDDSTFLSDGFFGNSLLLPNRDLDAAFQKFDLSWAYRLHPRVTWHATIENLSGERYQAAAGFPALPRTFRTGAIVRIGGLPSTR